MSLKERITKDYFNAMRTKDTVTKNLLSVVRGEIQNLELELKVETLSDEDILKILNKSSKTLKEVISLTNDQESVEQLVIVSEYLPKEMTRDEIVAKVNEIVSSGVTNIGGIMKAFATLPADRKVVGEVIKEVLV